MLEQIFEFIGNNLVLSGIFFALVVAFVINEGKQGGASVSTSNLVSLVNREGAVIVDIRDKKEFGLGHIVQALNMPMGSFDQRASELKQHKDKPIVVVDKMGQHSSTVGRKLKKLGFEDVRRLSGGMAEWSASNLPVVKK
jgi:rhodanese-related sulfurtransferase